MKISDLFERWELSSLKISAKFLEMEFNANPEDQEAAWELYVELITRIVTQRLPINDGDEKTALESAYSLFSTTRDVLKRKGRKCDSFSKIAIVVLNQVVRPFCSRWHKLELQGAFDNEQKCQEFRDELNILQTKMRRYAAMLAEIAQVEDMMYIEDV